MADTEGKKLTELRVIDLKTELEHRGLDKTGNKAALLERLAKAITEEGHNPDEFLIVPSIGLPKAQPSKKPIEAPVVDVEPVHEAEVDSQLEEKEEVMTNDNNEAENVEQTEINQSDTMEALIINISTQPEELDMDYQENEEDPIKVKSENTALNAEEAVETANEEKIKMPPTVETNGIDNEDSINLTIGEDEENLLAEESESNDKLKDGDDKEKSEESDLNNISINKKGDSKGIGKAEIVASDKEDSSTSSAAVTGPGAAAVKSKQDEDGNKSSEPAIKSPKKEEPKEKSSSTVNSRNLWVSGLSSTTRATDLKQIFSKYGKVFGAKVVTNARTPGARCYGYVTLSSSEDAEKCIQHLHKTELHGRVISVEKAKGDSQQRENRKLALSKTEKKEEKEKSKEPEPNDKETEKNLEEKKENDVTSKDKKETKSEDESSEREKRDTSSQNKEGGSVKDCDTQSNKSSGKKSDQGRGSSREDKKRSWDRTRSRSKSRDRTRRDNEERERQRARDKDRQAREEKRRQIEDMKRKRDIERETARLEREREKLRLERERIEQEKAELLRLERERQKLEREKLDRERQELKRQQQRLEENRRAPPPSASLKRPVPDRRESRDLYSEPERKRLATERSRHSPADRAERGRPEVMERVERRIENSRYEARKDVPPTKNFKNERGGFSSRGRPDNHFESVRGGRGGGRGRDTRPPPADHRLGKDRYERPSTFVRDRETTSHRGGRDTRYDNPKPAAPRDTRYEVTNRQTGWQSGPPSKPFNSANNRNEHSGWNSRSSDTRVTSQWNRSENVQSTMTHQRSQVYQSHQSQPAQTYNVSQNSSSYGRYEPYKSSMPNVRKYQ